MSASYDDGEYRGYAHENYVRVTRYDPYWETRDTVGSFSRELVDKLDEILRACGQ